MAEVLDVSSMVATKFEPKKKHQWIMQIEGIDAFIVKTSKRPTFSTPEIPLPFINSMRYVAGRTLVGELTVTLHDPIAPSGAQQVMEWIRLHTEHVSGRSGYSEFYKRDMQLKMLDPIGTVIELWDCKGCWLKEVDFGELDYGTDTEAMSISLTIRPDLCVLQF